MKTIEEWASEKGTEAWKLAGAKVREKGWGEGKLVDESAFDAAIAGVEGIKLHAYAPDSKLAIVPKPEPIRPTTRVNLDEPDDLDTKPKPTFSKR